MAQIPDYFCPVSGFWTASPSSWTDGGDDEDDDDGVGGGGGCGWTRSAPRSSCCTGLTVTTLVFGGSLSLSLSLSQSGGDWRPGRHHSAVALRPPATTTGLAQSRDIDIISEFRKIFPFS